MEQKLFFCIGYTGMPANMEEICKEDKCYDTIVLLEDAFSYGTWIFLDSTTGYESYEEAYEKNQSKNCQPDIIGPIKPLVRELTSEETEILKKAVQCSKLKCSENIFGNIKVAEYVHPVNLPEKEKTIVIPPGALETYMKLRSETQNHWLDRFRRRT